MASTYLKFHETGAIKTLLQEKLDLLSTFNPGLAIIGFRKTRPKPFFSEKKNRIFLCLLINSHKENKTKYRSLTRKDSEILGVKIEF